MVKQKLRNSNVNAVKAVVAQDKISFYKRIFKKNKDKSKWLHKIYEQERIYNTHTDYFKKKLKSNDLYILIDNKYYSISASDIVVIVKNQVFVRVFIYEYNQIVSSTVVKFTEIYEER